MRVPATASPPTRMSPAGLARAALPIVALLLFGAVVGSTLWAASRAGTLGYDFLAYHQAANRVLAGASLYDPTVEQTGGVGLFSYPPPFVLAILPLAPLDPAVATWIWVSLSVAALLGGIWSMPVSSTTRWLTLLLAA